ncbi:MAG TPA: lactate utilization protein C [Terracidiphilus sp.]|nr:lactate utilization protein C [Terracidiphilus sp.]
MSNGASSREKVLESIRKATPEAAASAEVREQSYAALPRNYLRRGTMDANERVERMIERLREYDAEVVECPPRELPAAIASRLKASGRQTFVTPAGVPAEWMAPGFEWKIDRELSVGEVEQTDGVLTGAFCGIADSGTIVLHHGPLEGRRVLTLLPDWHLCVLRASQVVEALPEYFARCEVAPALVTWISGPSATADIEMTRIKGVHGPRFLDVIVVRDETLSRSDFGTTENRPRVPEAGPGAPSLN